MENLEQRVAELERAVADLRAAQDTYAKVLDSMTKNLAMVNQFMDAVAAKTKKKRW